MAESSVFPVLESERLILREIISSDAKSLFTIHGDPERMRWYGNEPMKDLAAAKDMVRAFAAWRKLPNPGVRWGIQIKGQKKLIGTLGLFSWNRNWQRCILGYELTREEEGKGYMREAVVCALNWGFQNMGLNRVEAQVHPENLASMKLVLALGFVREGLLREMGFWDGKYHDMVQLGLLRREFVARR
jgi:[ribosomal protein S5]-alanine N-acetyltransferase